MLYFFRMTTATISKKISEKIDFITIPRIQYEGLLRRAKIEEIETTKSQKKALIQSRKDLKAGKLLSYEDVARKLGFTN